MEKLDDQTQSNSSLHANEASVTVNVDGNESDVDIENNTLVWFPPEPTDQNLALFDQYDDDSLSDHEHEQSILISSSSRCIWKGTVCEKNHLVRIEYHGSFDTTMVRLLKDHLLNQNYRCSSCEIPSEAHVYNYYADPKTSLVISVKKLPEILLGDGKVWTWQRCFKCPRTNDNGFLLPPSTHRIALSDAYLKLSFAKFLKLSFTNHAAESICGHSLHRDCLMFYGFENMIAHFRYSLIDVHSIKLPPQKLNVINSETDHHQHQELIELDYNEPTSIIAYALELPDYHVQLSDFGTFRPFLETMSESYISHGTEDITVTFDHDRLNNGDVDVYSVTCYYAKIFEAIRRTCCPSQADFIKSLHLRKNHIDAMSVKTSLKDDPFMIKEVTKAELESFVNFAQEYFKYIFESIGSNGPTCLAKILGIYQVSSKRIKEGNKGSKTYLLVMENHLFGRNLSRVYDLKGHPSNRDLWTKSNQALLDDENMIEHMSTSPVFVGSKDKKLFQRAVWNDTAFLASVNVSEYSLLAGVDGDRHELVVGIIDYFMTQQTTWNKNQLVKSCAKALGILRNNAQETLVSPKQYKKRFREAMASYFFIFPSESDVSEETQSMTHELS